jgi:hypothetical protein
MISLTEYSNSLSLTINSTDDDLVQDAVEVLKESIKTCNPRTLKQTQDGIFYTSGVMRLVSNMNLLYGISEGEIKIEKKDQTLMVQYVIRFYELIALSVIPAVGVLVILDSVKEKIIGLLIVFFFCYGAYALITILRYDAFIKKTMKDWLSDRDTVAIDEEQKEWINNINKCDACGHLISSTDTQCPDCGLRLQ